MDWVQFATMFISVIGLFIWNRTESRADIRHMDNKLDSMRQLIHAIHTEMNDFHNRLCKIEERKSRD